VIFAQKRSTASSLSGKLSLMHLNQTCTSSRTHPNTAIDHGIDRNFRNFDSMWFNRFRDSATRWYRLCTRVTCVAVCFCYFVSIDKTVAFCTKNTWACTLAQSSSRAANSFMVVQAMSGKSIISTSNKRTVRIQCRDFKFKVLVLCRVHSRPCCCLNHAF
jgi:hypothetical protein